MIPSKQLMSTDQMMPVQANQQALLKLQLSDVHAKTTVNDMTFGEQEPRMIASIDSGLDELYINNAYEDNSFPPMPMMPNSTKPRYTGVLSKQSKLKD